MSTDDSKKPAASVNPFAQQQGTANQAPKSFNPFASASGAASVNPFVNQGKGEQTESVNPFAGGGSASLQPTSPAQSANPFAAQPVGSMSPLSAPPSSSEAGPRSLSGLRPDASINPFQQESASAGVPASSPPPSASFNPLSSGSFDESASTSGFESDPTSSFSADFAESAFSVDSQNSYDAPAYDQEEADQLRQLAPLVFSPAEDEAGEFDMPPDLTAGMIGRKQVITIVLSAAGVALIIGLLFGIMLDQRREHNYRVDAWSDIDATLSRPLEQIDLIDRLVMESAQKRKIDWGLVTKLPENLKAIPPALVATRVPLQNSSVRKLSALVIETNLLFADVMKHRLLTLASRKELELKGDRLPFEQYGAYAVDLTDLLKGCVRKGRLSCRLPDEMPFGKVVALHGKASRGKVSVAIRFEEELFKVNPDYLVPVSKDQAVGFGGSPAQAYAIRLKGLIERLEKLREIKKSFNKVLEDKLKIKKVFAL